jgi:hypothetical protein
MNAILDRRCGTILAVFFAVAAGAMSGGSAHAQNLKVAGTVGVGTTSPQAKLHVVGGAIAAQAGAAQFVELWHDNAIIYGSSGGCCGSLRFGKADNVGAAGWVEQMRLSTDGNLGIGTLSPQSRLDINGDVAIGGVNAIRRDGSNAHLFAWGTGYPGNNVYFGAGIGGLPVFANSFNQFSSARYKKNISDSTYGLKEVLRLHVKRYEYKGGNKREIGLLAEEVAEIVPEVVALDERGRPDAIDYAKLSAVLIQAVQDLENENDQLKSAAAHAKSNDDELARRVARLERERLTRAAGAVPASQAGMSSLGAALFGLGILIYAAWRRRGA